jgi:hypothetical protein
VCTEEARASVQVTVDDGAGAPLNPDLITYSVDGGAAQDCELVAEAGAEFVCGYEVAGSIEIRVEKAGYLPFTDTVEVDEDECHVITEQLVVSLEEELPD